MKKELDSVVESDDKRQSTRERIAKELNLDLREPKQQRRIEALQKLFQEYADKSSEIGLICKKIIYSCDELISIYKQKRIDLHNIKSSSGENFTSKKTQIEGIYYRSRARVKELESDLQLYKKLFKFYGNKFFDSDLLSPDSRRKIKELKNESWECWLKALDVNKELRNTIIGFENRKALLAISDAYIDYYMCVESEISKCFRKLKEQKKMGIAEYYDILSRYQLPIDKRIDFKVFLQKKIESTLMDSIEIKSTFGKFVDLQSKQIDILVKEVTDQYERDREDMIAVINHFKKFLLNKQVLFTNESEHLVIYFKKRYIEKIDYLCSRFQLFFADHSALIRNFSNEKIELIKKFIDEEYQSQLNKLKIEYSKKIFPFLDNYWYLELDTKKTYVFDEETLNKKLKDLKMSKMIGMKSFIAEFEESRNKIKKYFDKKLGTVVDVKKFSVESFDNYLADLKDECDAVCCEIVNENARFWTKINAKFNCEVRRHLIKIRKQYSPYIESWKKKSKPWMNEYLQNNLNRELLKSAGESLIGFSPESDLYINASNALLKFNEIFRKIQVNRDEIEARELLALNTLPFDYADDISVLEQRFTKKIEELKKCYDSFQKDCSDFYNSILGVDSSYEIKN